MANEIPVEELQEVVQRVTWQRGVIAAATLLGFFLAAKIAGHLIRRGFGREGPVFAFSKLLTYFLCFVGAMTAVGLLGIPLSSLALISSALLIGIGFSLQPVARDLVAGVIILVEQSIRKNDFVSFVDTTGTVLEIGLRATKLLNRDGMTLVVPNHLLVTTEVTNHSHPLKRTRLRVEVPLSIREDVDLAAEAVSSVAQGHPRVLSEPPPIVRLEAIEQWGFRVALIVWVEEASATRGVASELRFAIVRAFVERRIDFPTPELLLHAPSGAPTS